MVLSHKEIEMERDLVEKKNFTNLFVYTIFCFLQNVRSFKFKALKLSILNTFSSSCIINNFKVTNITAKIKKLKFVYKKFLIGLQKFPTFNLFKLLETFSFKLKLFANLTFVDTGVLITTSKPQK